MSRGSPDGVWEMTMRKGKARMLCGVFGLLYSVSSSFQSMACGWHGLTVLPVEREDLYHPSGLTLSLHLTSLGQWIRAGTMSIVSLFKTHWEPLPCFFLFPSHVRIGMSNTVIMVPEWEGTGNRTTDDHSLHAMGMGRWPLLFQVLEILSLQQNWP